MKHRNILAALGLTSALFLTACGGGDGDQAAAGEAGIDPAAIEGLGGEDVAAEFETLYAAALDEGQDVVSIYTPLTATWPKVFEAFEERFPGIAVEPLQIVGAEMDTKISQEQASGQVVADLVMTGDTGAVGLADKDAFIEYRPFNAEEMTSDPEFSLDSGTLTTISASPRGFVYDTRKEDEIVPESWEDLLDPSLKGKIVMDKPNTDGGGLQMTDLILHDDRLGQDYLEDLAAQDLIMSPTTAECHNLVVQGRAYICLMGAMGNYLTLTGEGAPVEIVHPVEGGNWATYFYAGIVDGAPNQEAAKLFLSWVNSPEANEVKAEIGSGPATNAEGLDLPFENPGDLDQLERPALADVAARQSDSMKIMDEIFN